MTIRELLLEHPNRGLICVATDEICCELKYCSARTNHMPKALCLQPLKCGLTELSPAQESNSFPPDPCAILALL